MLKTIRQSRRILAAALTCTLTATVCTGTIVAAQAEELPEGGSAATTTTATGAAGEDTTVKREAVALKVNQFFYLALTGTWRIDNSDTSVIGIDADGRVTAKGVGKATIECVSDDGETRILEVTVSKSSFKPVTMKKLQCYKSYRKYMTETQFKKAYKKALELVTPAGDLAKKEKLQYVTSTLRRYFEENMTYESKKPHYNDPYGYLCLKRASCAGATRTTKLCLNILGVKAEHVNENKWTHQWCRVKVGKSYWIADPYGMYCGKEPAKRQHPYL